MMKKAIVGFNQHGRRLLKKLTGKDNLYQIPKAEPVVITQASKASSGVIQRLTGKSSGVFSRFVTNNVTSIWVQELRNAARFRTHSGSFPLFGDYRAMGTRMSMYAFVAFGMAANARVTEPEIPVHLDEIQNEVKGRISDMLAKKNRLIQNDPELEKEPLSLDQFSFGPMIAKGCSGAVYEAKYTPPESDIDILSEVDEDGEAEDQSEEQSDSIASDIEVLSHSEVESLPPLDFDAEDEDEEVGEQTEESYSIASDIEVLSLSEVESLPPLDFDAESDITIIEESEASSLYSYRDEPDLQVHQASMFNLAVKMMFNFDTESLAYAIWDRMQNELVPSNGSAWQMEVWHSGTKAKMKRLPPHPNIVAMEGSFVGEVPQLTNAFEEFPDALPERINPDGYGRNKTLFIVMKKYPLTLRQYLQSHDLSLKESVLIFVQLLEAIVHLQNHGYAHRDLKSDNLLVDFDRTGSPVLVLTDFGCCLSSGTFGLRVHYSSGDVCKGGNGALMAPEIACAVPGWLNWLDYSRSDVWAAGAIAYEIFGAENPFYRNGGVRLDSRTYDVNTLPSLPDHVPVEIANVVYSLLNRDPSKRLPVVSAANVLHRWLWCPAEGALLTSRWLMSTAACVMLRSTFDPSLQNTLQALFLSHFDS
eukprot:GHVO01051167.1.p1 GENE.GHVO01051167.1~~GHVO01051167.1.p1  ORF type:complete len:646 (-),score=79.31 GHVO01051167.1:16-1953(-)